MFIYIHRIHRAQTCSPRLRRARGTASSLEAPACSDFHCSLFVLLMFSVPAVCSLVMLVLLVLAWI